MSMSVLFRLTPLVFLPVLAYAQTFQSLVGDLIFLINVLVGLVMALSVAVFFYGMARYVFRMGAGSAGSYQSGYSLMLWGILVFFVMASIYGIINIVTGTIFF